MRVCVLCVCMVMEKKGGARLRRGLQFTVYGLRLVQSCDGCFFDRMNRMDRMGCGLR